MTKKHSKKIRKVRRQSATTASLPTILKILATTDFSPESRSGVRYAVALADKLRATVALLHVIDPRSWRRELGSIISARETPEVVASARKQLAKMAKSEGKGLAAVTCAVSVRSGNPFQAIITAACQRSADLIVIATRGYTGADRVLLGSTAERVVRHAPCPVLTVPTRAKPKRIGKTLPFTIKKILVPIDFSRISKDALPWATLLAAQFEAKVILLHVVEKLPVDYLLGRGLTKEPNLPLTRLAAAGLERMSDSLGESGVNATGVVGEGRPFEEISRTAKTLGADLIVLTTRGYTGLKNVWLGSTAERLVRYAPCPVLVVRKQIQKVLVESHAARTSLAAISEG